MISTAWKEFRTGFAKAKLYTTIGAFSIFGQAAPIPPNPPGM